MSKYDDIINLPYKKTTKHPHMSLSDRAAQFSPFAALTGHKEAINETARLTDEKIDPDEYIQEEINRKLRQAIKENLSVKITYFLPDKFKSGGKYVTCVGKINKYIEYENMLVTDSGTSVPLDDIFNIEIENN